MIPAVLAMALAAATPAPAVPVEAPGPDGPLRGTMIAPRPGAPVLLVLPGSGPTDRDGNNAHGIRAASYRLLAEGLAARGIGTVRIDKRGLFGSRAAVADANAVTVDDYVRDTRAWVSVVRRRTGAGCVWLMGHSEGGLVALAAARMDGVCGLVLLATPGRPLGDVLKAQLRANPANAPLLPEADRAIDSLTAGVRVDAATLPPPLAPLFAPQVQGFLISAFALDPATLAARAGKPILIVQGGRDLQVGSVDAERLARAATGARLVTLAEMNHVLKRVASDDAAANLATYAAADLPLASGLVDAIAGFVARVPERGAGSRTAR